MAFELPVPGEQWNKPQMSEPMTAAIPDKKFCDDPLHGRILDCLSAAIHWEHPRGGKHKCLLVGVKDAILVSETGKHGNPGLWAAFLGALAQPHHAEFLVVQLPDVMLEQLAGLYFKYGTELEKLESWVIRNRSNLIDNPDLRACFKDSPILGRIFNRLMGGGNAPS